MRIWRLGNGISFWAGAGWGFEWDRSLRHYREVDCRYKEGEDECTWFRDENFTGYGPLWGSRGMLIGTVGLSVPIDRRVLVRFGYTCLMGDPDSSLAGSVNLGIGYRF